MRTLNTNTEPTGVVPWGVPLFPTPQVLVTDAIAGNARWHAHKTAVVCGKRRLTWREFNARANRVANALLDLGISTGDRIAVLMPNSVEAAETMCGALKAGGVVVPLSTLLTGPGIVRQISDAEAKVVFVGAPLEGSILPHKTELTGVPKGIVHTHFARQQFALALAVACRIHFGTVGILTTPLYSNGTWIVWLPTIVAGGTVVIMPRLNHACSSS
jgi:acyl-CoA synthetase (AMP-forming)/AMP-acid ligase II